MSLYTALTNQNQTVAVSQATKTLPASQQAVYVTMTGWPVASRLARVRVQCPTVFPQVTITVVSDLPSYIMADSAHKPLYVVATAQGTSGTSGDVVVDFASIAVTDPTNVGLLNLVVTAGSALPQDSLIVTAEGMATQSYNPTKPFKYDRDMRTLHLAGGASLATDMSDYFRGGILWDGKPTPVVLTDTTDALYFGFGIRPTGVFLGLPTNQTGAYVLEYMTGAGSWVDSHLYGRSSTSDGTATDGTGALVHSGVVKLTDISSLIGGGVLTIDPLAKMASDVASAVYVQPAGYLYNPPLFWLRLRATTNASGLQLFSVASMA